MYRRVEEEGDANLVALVPGMELGGGLTTDGASLARIVDLAFGANPRSTKRFINALSLVLDILDRRGAGADPRTVAALLAGEMRWPDEFSDLRTAVRAGDPAPLRPFVESADAGLNAFAAAHLAADMEAQALAGILRLTGTVTLLDVPGAEPDDGSFHALTERNHQEIERRIAERGFVLATQSKVLWYPPDRRDLRVRFARQVVRVERRSAGGAPEWELERSFSMGHEMEGFLDYLDLRLATQSQA